MTFGDWARLGINSRHRRLSTSPETVRLFRAEDKPPFDKLVTTVLVKFIVSIRLDGSSCL
jgi:hypothetical protein